MFSRFLLGVLFIFSGFVKAIDPMGSAFKFGDYFHAFGLDFLNSFSLVLAIFLATFELVLGVVLILGYQKRIAYWLLFLFMSFFTILTFILALTNPVSDCGCFGDAIIMTNWQTFFKNLIFMVFVIMLFVSRGRTENVHSNLFERGIILIFFVAGFILSAFCLRHLPLLDFRPYDVGTFISEEMEIPEDAPRDEYSTILFYENLTTGKVEEFTIENYPQDTLKYSFINSESKLIKKGYEPPIHDFGISDKDGYDRTDEILRYRGYTLIFTSYELENVNEDELIKGNNWAKMERLSGDFQFVALTSSATATITELTNSLNLEYDFSIGDEIMIKTMVRSNPGYLLLKNGTIVGKWSWKDFPDLTEWNSTWKDLLVQYDQEMDPEIALMVEEGFQDDFNYDIVDFDITANKVLANRIIVQSDSRVWTIFVLFVLLVLTGLMLSAQKSYRKRG